MDSIVEGEIVNKNEYSLFVKVADLDIDAFLHWNDLTYLNNGEEELAKFKKGDKVKANDEIGIVFTNESTGKTILKFNIFNELKPENPATWLAR